MENTEIKKIVVTNKPLSYSYKLGRNVLSLLFPGIHTMMKFEVYGEGMPNVERFDTLLEAENRIEYLLNTIQKTTTIEK